MQHLSWLGLPYCLWLPHHRCLAGSLAMYIVVWRNTLSNLEEYILYFLIWTNTFSNLDKYIFWIGKILCSPMTDAWRANVEHVSYAPPYLSRESAPPLSAACSSWETRRIQADMRNPPLDRTHQCAPTHTDHFIFDTTRAFSMHLCNLSGPCFNQRPVLFILEGKMPCGAYERS